MLEDMSHMTLVSNTCTHICLLQIKISVVLQNINDKDAYVTVSHSQVLLSPTNTPNYKFLRPCPQIIEIFLCKDIMPQEVTQQSNERPIIFSLVLLKLSVTIIIV
jgi:hypothetical protein